MPKNDLLPSALDQFAQTGGILGLVILGFFVLIGISMILKSRREGKEISDILVSIQRLRAEFYRSGIFQDNRRNVNGENFRRRRDD